MSVGDTLVRAGSAATVGELAQRIEQLERFLSGGVGPIDLMGTASHGAVDIGGPAQAFRRLYALGITVGAVDLDLTTVAQQLTATSPAIYTAAGAHDATTDVTTLRFMVLGVGGQGGGGGGGAVVIGNEDEPSSSGWPGLPAAFGGSIIQRAVSTDSITVNVGSGGDGGDGGLSDGSVDTGTIHGRVGSIGGSTTVAVNGIVRVTLTGGTGGNGGLTIRLGASGHSNNTPTPAPVTTGPGSGGSGRGTGMAANGGAGIQGAHGFCLLIPVA